MLTEFKGGKSAADGGPDAYDQMERQHAVANDLADRNPGLYSREIHWRFNAPPGTGAMDNAKALQAMYPDMKIRYFSSTGFEYQIV